MSDEVGYSGSELSSSSHEESIEVDSECTIEEHDKDFDSLEQIRSRVNSKPLSNEALAKFNSKIEQSGVCYLSRVPPFMKHIKLRNLLSKYGEINRIYLAPEDAKIAAKRKKFQRTRRVNFTEGWIEFEDKKVARNTALALNNNIIGGKKRGYYHDDIWNIKYLPKFKWHHLSEQLAYEHKVKEHKMRTEMAQATKETGLFLQNIKQSKMFNALNEKRKLKNIDLDPKFARKITQRKPVDDKAKGKVLSKEKQEMLSKLFS
jgi:ESF2/ABP1 family protein